MELVRQWFHNNLDVVYFFYGLAFLLMGIALLLQPKKGSEFKIANVFWLLAAFGISHGLHEWLEMWGIIKKTNLDPLNFVAVTASFFFLFEFGRQLLVITKDRFPSTLRRGIESFQWWIGILLLADIVVMSFMGTDFWKTGITLASYLLAFPGGIATGIAMILYYQSEKGKPAMLKSGGYMRISGISFIVYGCLEGLMVEKGTFFPATVINEEAFDSFTAFPVEVFHAVCAVFIAMSVIAILNIFSEERTRQKQRIMDELDKKNRELEKLDKLKSEFLSMVSHELKTPLTSIVGFANTLTNLHLSEEQRTKYLNIIESEGKRLGSLVKEYLDISMLEMGALSMPKVLSDIQLLIMDTLESLPPHQNIPFVLEFPGRLPDVLANKDRIKQVLINILDNIIKYSPDGGTVKITGENEEDSVRICIMDEGPGIPANELDRIFDKFHRVNGNNRESIQGAGLGLAIAKGIIEAHHGKIWADSKIGKGTMFCFSLPKPAAPNSQETRIGEGRKHCSA
jgi:signal transduction histidine kinase